MQKVMHFEINFALLTCCRSSVKISVFSALEHKEMQRIPLNILMDE